MQYLYLVSAKPHDQRAALGGRRAETLPELTDGYVCLVETDINLKTAGISTVIWALGHAFDFSLVKLPVFDDAGFPLTHSGVTEAAGLYFSELPWLP